MGDTAGDIGSAQGLKEALGRLAEVDGQRDALTGQSLRSLTQ